MSTCDWAAVLDTFEARLHAQRAALSMGGGAVSEWQPPELEAPLPADLADRAADLVWQCRQLEDEIEQALTTASAALDRLLAAPPAPVTAAEPVYFDSKV